MGGEGHHQVKILLPVNRESFEYVARQVRLRGQSDRIDGAQIDGVIAKGSTIDLADVVLQLNEDEVLDEPLYGVPI